MHSAVPETDFCGLVPVIQSPKGGGYVCCLSAVEVDRQGVYESQLAQF